MTAAAIERPIATSKAIDAYETASCSAILGVHLFKHGESCDRKNAPIGPALFLSLGDCEWIKCETGLGDLFSRLDVYLAEYGWMRSSEFPDDWGIIANEQGQVLYRALTNGHVRPVTYLGHFSGPVSSTGLITVQEMGLGLG